MHRGSEVDVLGVAVSCIGPRAAVDAIAALADSAPASQVATVNAEFVMRSRHDPEFRRALASSSLRLPDGAGVVWAMRRGGCPGAERVAGVDLLEPLARRCAADGRSMFFLGGGPGVAEAAARRLLAAAPGLRVAGAHGGDGSPAGDAETVARVRAASPDVLLVAYGAPRQELWISRNLERSGARVAIGVGGAFDFITGRARRAPEWMRRSGLEWLHRLVREPWRARRMAVLPLYAWLVIRQPKRGGALGNPR